MASGTLNARIVRIRKREGLAVRTVARRLGMTRGEYAAWESDTHQLTVNQAFRIADAMNVSMSDLVGSDGAAEASLRKSIIKTYKILLTLRELGTHNVKLLCDKIMAELRGAVPECAELKPWPLGHRREADELGQTAMNPIPAVTFEMEPYAHAI
jgi:transcriptional regulator with XRE-family HTH domain